MTADSNSPEEGSSSSEQSATTFSIPSSGVKLWKTLAVTSILVLVIIGGFYAHEKYQDKLESVYGQGVYDGQLNYVSQQQQTGQVTFLSNHTGNLTLEVTTFEKICGGGQ